MNTEREMKTHDDIVDNLNEQLVYLDTLPDFNESCTTLYIFEAIQEIKKLRAALPKDTKEPDAWLFPDKTYTTIAAMGKDHRGLPVYTSPPSTAALQKRIEELEAVISKKDKALRKVKNSGALHGMASSSHEERQKVRDALDNALALKAGDVQAPKLVPIEPTETMLKAGWYAEFPKQLDGESRVQVELKYIAATYKAMIAAAPGVSE